MADMDNTPLKPSEQPFEPLPTPKAVCELCILKVGHYHFLLQYLQMIDLDVSLSIV